MDHNIISHNIAEFKATKNPVFLAKAIYLLMIQGRIREAFYGVYCDIFYRPSLVQTYPAWKPQAILENFKLLLSTKEVLFRDDIINIFGDDYAVRYLPECFFGARMESIIFDRKFLVIGEYGDPGKRVAFVTQQSCVVNEFYNEDAAVRHIHSVYKSPDSRDIIVTTGDNAKYLDLWEIQNSSIIFNRRLKKRLAGQTAILKVGNEYYLGTDFSNRTNYIENLDGRKFIFPKKACKMYVTRFQQYQDRYIASLNKELPRLGGRYTLSIFDVEQKEFVYCDYHDVIKPKMVNKALHRTAVKLRSIDAGELNH
jgi:hypothetical protein